MVAEASQIHPSGHTTPTIYLLCIANVCITEGERERFSPKEYYFPIFEMKTTIITDLIN